MVMELRSLDFTGERVKRIRVMLGETQKQFAVRLGVHPNMVGLWEAGRSKPTSAPALKALLEAEEVPA